MRPTAVAAALVSFVLPQAAAVPGMAALGAVGTNMVGFMSSPGFSAFAGAEGVVASTLGIVSFIMNKFPPKGADFQIKLGLQEPDWGGSDMGGKFKEIEAYDVFNRLVGSHKGHKVRHGGVWEGKFQMEKDAVQVDYMSLLAGTDSVCIAWITVKSEKNPDAAAGAWNGDIGRHCGQAWYASNQIAGSFENGSDWRPACTWLDGDDDNGFIPGSASMKWSVQAYSDSGSPKTLEAGQECSSTLFSRENHLIRKEKPASPEDRLHKQATKRSVFPEAHGSMIDVARKPWMKEQIIVADQHFTHNATNLCLDKMSYGPDFVGSDGYMCDMDTRELFPVCKFHKVPGCVEIDHESKTLKKRSNLFKRSEDHVHKSYKLVERWH